MAAGFAVDFLWYPVGHGDYLHAFFSTISYHLEPNGWGSKYPCLLIDLYDGELSWELVPKAIEEAKEIRAELEKFSPDQIIWDIEDLSKQPPWGSNVSTDVTSLANYFTTSHGRDLFEYLLIALEESWSEKVNIKIVSL